MRLQRQVGITFILVTHDQEEALVMSDRIAVMFEGEVAQIAEAEALYRRPVSRRVAEFIGVMNFLPASVSGTSVEVAGLGAMDRAALQSEATTDGAPMAGFRPETATLLFDGQEATDRVAEGEVTEVVYYGDMTYYDVRLDGAAEPVRVSMRNVFGRPVLEIGTRARLAWSPGAVTLFALTRGRGCGHRAGGRISGASLPETAMRPVLLAAFLLAPLAAAAQDMTVRPSEEGYLNLRAGPGTIHDVARRLAPGDRVSVLETMGKWARVRLPSGERGWVSLDYLERAAATDGVLFVARTGAGYLNMRVGAGTGHAVIRRVYPGDRLLPLGREGDWLRVRHATGTEGWVHGDYVTR